MLNGMTNSHIIYASYGSNLLEERFLRYIVGGRIAGNIIDYTGARDKTLPKSRLPLLVPGVVYMSGAGSHWGPGGYAFYDPTVEGETTRMAGWVVTEEQFYDVVAQENGLPIGEVADLGLHEFNEYNREKVLPYANEYARIIYLGEQEGLPIFTFTNPKAKKDFILNPASPAYYDVILRGLVETFPDEDYNSLRDYLDKINTN
jgi:hypothetical protein